MILRTKLQHCFCAGDVFDEEEAFKGSLLTEGVLLDLNLVDLTPFGSGGRGGGGEGNKTSILRKYVHTYKYTVCTYMRMYNIQAYRAA